jgi:hypothetical protein
MMPKLYRSLKMGLPRLHQQRLSSDIKPTFLHIGPSGDCWTGTSIFAAKHLQPDYVKSIPLPSYICAESLLELLEDNKTLAQQVYDNQKLPEDLLKCMLPKKSS